MNIKLIYLTVACSLCFWISGCVTHTMTKEAMTKDLLGKTDWDGRTDLKSLKQYERMHGKQFKTELDECIALQKECKDNRKVWRSDKKQEKATAIEKQCGKSWTWLCN